MRLTLRRPLLMLVTEPHPRLGEIVAEAIAGGVDVVQWRGTPPLPPNPGGGTDVSPMTSLTPSLLANMQGPIQAVAVCDEAGGLDYLRTESLPPGLGGREAIHLINAALFTMLPPWAHGIHLPERAENLRDVRADQGTEILIGRSIHSVDAARLAEEDGADYVIAGTIFASNSHPGTPPAGLGLLRDVCRAVTIPVIAIGGVTPDNARDCMTTGACGIAVLSPIMRSETPRMAAAAYRGALDGVARE